MKPHSITVLSRTLISIPNFSLLDVFLSYFPILASFYLFAAGVESFLDALTSNGDSMNITSGEKRVSYKPLCCVKLRFGLIISIF
jgi:hypothetical protein